jgi:hypothetical protein
MRDLVIRGGLSRDADGAMRADMSTGEEGAMVVAAAAARCDEMGGVVVVVRRPPLPPPPATTIPPRTSPPSRDDDEEEEEVERASSSLSALISAGGGEGDDDDDIVVGGWEEVDGIVGGEEGTEDSFSDGRNDERVNADDADAASFAIMEETWLGLGGIATIVPSSVTVHLCIRPRWCRCCRWCCRPGDVRGMATVTGAPVMSTSC